MSEQGEEGRRKWPVVPESRMVGGGDARTGRHDSVGIRVTCNFFSCIPWQSGGCCWGGRLVGIGSTHGVGSGCSFLVTGSAAFARSAGVGRSDLPAVGPTVVIVGGYGALAARLLWLLGSCARPL
eukprot:scaffold4774_cov95-Cylindrotheca_fusiformis.AAC.1